MILNYFPDHTEPDFNLDAPCPVFGWPTMIIHARGSDVSYPEHYGPLSIKCAFGGSEIYEADGRVHTIDDLSYLILNDGQRYSSTIPAGGDVEAFCVFFRPGFVQEIITALITPSDTLADDPELLRDEPANFLDMPYQHDTVISPILFRIRHTISARPVTQGWLDDNFALLIERLLQRHTEIADEIARLPAVRASTRVELYRRLTRARDFLDANIATKTDLTDAARVACLSLHHFIRLFKHVFRETPHQYLTRKRLERAQHLLATTDRPVTQICTDVGFESLGSFSWLFRRRIGTSPDLYRKLTNGACTKKSGVAKGSEISNFR